MRQSQKLEAIGRLSGGIAHDFNNLLTAILGHLDLLRDNPEVTEPIRESLGEISAAAQRAASLTSQLLAFSRRQVINVTALDLNELVTNLTRLLRRLVGEHISIQLDYAPEPLVLAGDAGMIEQVIVNLAVNARDAMNEGGVLRITTRAEERAAPADRTDPAVHAHRAWIRLSVADTGVGIPPEIQPQIFEPFFTTKDIGRGTGLGLATVFGIVQQHHGWIEFESKPGQGTVFHVFLPRRTQAVAEAKPEPPPAPPRGRGELILLVEDEIAVQQLARRALERYGYRVLPAANGHHALEVWAQHRAEVELLLTDMIMPGGLNGIQLSRQLLGEKPELKVIYMSGYSADVAGKELRAVEGVNYLAKPYELGALYRTVRNALDASGAAMPRGL